MMYVNNTNNIFRRFKAALFAEYLKLFMPISSIDDCNKPKYYPNKFRLWSVNNGRNLNTGECIQTMFSKKKQNFILNYYINNK